MNFSSKSLALSTGILTASVLAAILASPPAEAQITLTAADSNVGAPGTPGGTNPDGNGGLVGNSGSSGYAAQGNISPTYTVNGPTFTGGSGGEITGTDPAVKYTGGFGGSGFSVGKNATATINSGSFTGGVGGPAGGVGQALIGGYAGDGLNVNTGTANVYGGTFLGGDSGTATGTGALQSQFAGSGVNSNIGGTINIFGGSFTGGNGMVIPGGSNGYAGAGLIDLSGILNVYGGTFTGGTNGDGLDVYVGTTTLYGTDFFVNGVATGNGPITGSGTITGNLLDNIGSSTFTYNVIGGTLDINSPVPEASTTISFGLLLALGLGGVIAARKRRVIA